MGIEGSLQTIEIRTSDERWQHDPADEGDAGGWVARDGKRKAVTVRLQRVQFECVDVCPL